MQLNQRAYALLDSLRDCAEELRITWRTSECGTLIVDFGVEVAGGLLAGCALAEVSLADLGHVSISPAPGTGTAGPRVQSVSDHPVAACLASQYAGWRVAEGNFFTMLSGPIRAAVAKDPIFEKLKLAGLHVPERTDVAVGVIEGRVFPPDSVCVHLAREARVAPDALALVIAPTASLAGSVQVVARSIETALHKMAELGFDLSRVQSGYGIAPLPPVAGGDLAAIGRTNDAILYGGEVTLWMRGGGDQIEQLGPSVPSNSSADFGRPFAELFAAAGNDFCKIDPRLFSPAVVNFIELETGRSWRFGQLRNDVIEHSFSR